MGLDYSYDLEIHTPLLARALATIAQHCAPAKPQYFLLPDDSYIAVGLSPHGGLSERLEPGNTTSVSITLRIGVDQPVHDYLFSNFGIDELWPKNAFDGECAMLRCDLRVHPEESVTRLSICAPTTQISLLFDQ